jgi:hypothetical protein
MNFPPHRDRYLHAGEVETSWILASSHGLVDMQLAESEFFSRLEDDAMVRPVGAPHPARVAQPRLAPVRGPGGRNDRDRCQKDAPGWTRRPPAWRSSWRV